MVDRSTTWLQQVENARGNGTHLPVQHGFQTKYRYNTLDAIVSQKTPDAGVSQLWYDRLGRFVASQNARQADLNKYSYTEYDQLGRVKEIDEVTSSAAMATTVSRDEAGLANWFVAVAGTGKDITRTQYDIPYDGSDLQLQTRNLRNRVTWTSTYNGAADLPNKYVAGSFYSYDVHGNVSSVWQAYKMGDNEHNLLKRVDYDYDPVSGQVNKVSYQPGMLDAFYHRYSYDEENRLVNVHTSRYGVYWENDAFYQYNRQGSLARSVIGQEQVQGLDYVYTLQGWLKGINSVVGVSNADIGGDGQAGSLVGKDAFGFVLHYFGTDYKPLDNTLKPFAEANVSGVQFKSLYNGNICASSIRLPSVGEPCCILTSMMYRTVLRGCRHIVT